MDNESQIYTIITITFELAAISEALRLLRTGNKGAAAEILEGALDKCIMHLEHMRKHANPVVKADLAKNALTIARSYRRQFPRTPNEIIAPTDPEIESAVRRILEEIEP